MLKKFERVLVMSADAERFARLVLDAFTAAGRTTDLEIGNAGGPSTSTMTKIRAAAEGAPLAEPRQPTWRKIERAANWPAGTARQVWQGEDPPGVASIPAQPTGARPIGDPDDELVEFRVSGAFGVQAVVRGPIRDIDALQAAVSKLIAGMRVEDVSDGNVT